MTAETTSKQLFENQRVESPLFSVCIPQYNRTSFLIKCLERFVEQTFQELEICISDGGSTDGRHLEIVEMLEGSSLSYRYLRHEGNLQYDPNLRASLGLARGRYCLLFGNDDMLATREELAFLHDQVVRHDFPEIVITNFRSLLTGVCDRRMRRPGILGAGPEVAIAHFRNFSFVSGVLLNREGVRRHETDEWDGSEMYQMFLGTRILAEGGRLLSLTEIVVDKDIPIPGEQAGGHYANRPKFRPPWFTETRLPLMQYAQVAYDAVAPCVEEGARDQLMRRIYRQVIAYTYPPWLIEYRRVQSWRYALSVALGMRPRNLLGPFKASPGTRVFINALYLLVTVAGLTAPVALFRWLRAPLYSLAKRFR